MSELDPSANAVLSALRAQLSSRGFDLCAAFGANAASLRRNGVHFPIERFGLESPMAVVIGNSRHLWRFVAERIERANPGRFPDSAPGSNPLDEYVERELPNALDTALAAHRLRQRQIYFSHRTDYPSFDDTGAAIRGAIPIQRLAALAGLAALAPSHLSVHPQLGPWIALRAVAVFPLSLQRTLLPQIAPCHGCSAPCVSALEQALSAASSTSGRPSERWIAVRDACPFGRKHRYGPDQLRYHYSVLDRRLGWER